MSNQPFNNETDQQIRRQVLKDTFLNRAQADAEMSAGGRFKKQTAETRVTGVPTYPKQPANSPWSNDPVPPEEPLGFSINEFPSNLGGSVMAPADAPMSPDAEISDPPKPQENNSYEPCRSGSA